MEPYRPMIPFGIDAIKRPTTGTVTVPEPTVDDPRTAYATALAQAEQAVGPAGAVLPGTGRRVHGGRQFRYKPLARHVVVTLPRGKVRLARRVTKRIELTKQGSPRFGDESGD